MHSLVSCTSLTAHNFTQAMQRATLCVFVCVCVMHICEFEHRLQPWEPHTHTHTHRVFIMFLYSLAPSLVPGVVRLGLGDARGKQTDSATAWRAAGMDSVWRLDFLHEYTHTCYQSDCKKEFDCKRQQTGENNQFRQRFLLKTREESLCNHKKLFTGGLFFTLWHVKMLKCFMHQLLFLVLSQLTVSSSFLSVQHVLKCKTLNTESLTHLS